MCHQKSFYCGVNFNKSFLDTFILIAGCIFQVKNNYVMSSISVFHVPWITVVTWSLLASEHYYSTGHQTVVTTIQWQSAFHGFHGDFNHYILPASLILINTFGSYILTVFSLPLLIFWPRVRYGIIFLFNKPRQRQVKDSRGEFLLHEDENRLWIGMFQTLIGFVTIQGLKVGFINILNILYVKIPICSLENAILVYFKTYI